MWCHQKQSHRKTTSKHNCRNKIYFYYSFKSYLKKFEYRIRLSIKCISQQTVITVHKKCLCKACSTIDKIHYKKRYGQFFHQKLFCSSFYIRKHKWRNYGCYNNHKTYNRNSHHRFPQYFLVPVYKQ